MCEKCFIFQATVGFGMNIAGILVMLLSMNTWTYFMFNLGHFPEWAALRVAKRMNLTAPMTASANDSLLLI